MAWRYEVIVRMTYEELLAENQRLLERIRELEQENARLKGLDGHVLCEPEPLTYGGRRLMTEEQKEEELQRRVALFRSLFRGRVDVYAKRFVSRSTDLRCPSCKAKAVPPTKRHSLSSSSD